MILKGKIDIVKYLTEKIEDTVPSGWKTTRQWAKECGRKQSTVQKVLRDGVRDGKIITKRFNIQSGEYARPVPHYKLK